MAKTSSISELVLRWQELRDQGCSVSAEELCAGCPEQLEELKRQIEALRSMQRFLDTSAGDAPSAATPGTLLTGGEAGKEFAAQPENEASAEPMSGLDLRGYELIERLGGGGMGDVYRAADPALGRDLAVKVMRTELRGFASAERRFLREARVTGSLQHPGIVSVHNLGRLKDGRLHYTMRLVRGDTFADILRDTAGKPEHTPVLLPIFERVCQAVAYAHSKHVIHRDLKPSNVMVGRFGEVQVMDWGLAKLLTPGEETTAAETPADLIGTRIHTEAADTPVEQTRMGREMGTPAYMPPEQALGEWDTVDERADVFALGALLCEVLTGQPPYTGQTWEEVLRKAKRGEHVEALARLEGCGADGALTALCRECLAPRREDRPRDAAVVAQRVAAYQTDVQDRLRRAELERTEAVIKAREERKRRRWVIAALLLLLVGAAASAWQSVRATRAEAETKAVLGRETQAWKRTREALNTLTDDVMEQLLGKQAVLGEKEKAFLRKVLGFYEQFAAERGEGEEARAVAAEGQFRVANLRAFLGENAAAEEGYRAAVRLYEALAGDFPAVPQYRQDLARSHGNLGNQLTRRGQNVQAEAEYRQTLRLLEELVGEYPDVPEYRKYLARSHHTLGFLLRGRGERADAEVEFHKALVMLEKLAEEFPAVPQYRKELVSLHINLGALLADLLKGAEAEAEFHKALVLLEKLAEEFPAEPDNRRSLAYNYHDLALLLADLGRGAEAEKAHRQALALRKKLAGEFPALPQYRLELARSHGNLGRLLRGSPARGAEAEAEYNQALTLLEKLAVDFPDMPAYRAYLAYHYLGLGILMANLGKSTEAETAYHQAIERLVKLTSEISTITEYRQELAHAYNHLGLLLAGQGKAPDAEAAYRQALILREKLASEFPAMPAYRQELAGSYVNFGNLLLSRSQPQAALDWYAKAIPLLQSVLAQDARLAEARLFLRNAHLGRARVLDQLGRHAESARDWQRAAELDDGRSRSAFRLQQSAALAHSGKHQEAVKTVEKLLASSDPKGKPAPSGPLLYNSACVYALSAAAVKDDAKQREQYAARAVALLRQAKKTEFFKDPRQVENFKRDTDLDALRQREDYQKFAAELAEEGKR